MSKRQAPFRGFTILELLVVIAILSILLAIGIQISSSVVSAQKTRSSENIIRAMDQVLGEYVTAKGSLPSPFFQSRLRDVIDPTLTGVSQPEHNITFAVADGRFEGQGGRSFPIITGVANNVSAEDQRYDADRDPPQPSLTLFLHQMKDLTGAEGVMKSLDARFVSRVTVTAWGWNNDSNPTQLVQFDQPTGNDATRPPILGYVVRDALGQPIRYVHPFFSGGYGEYANPTQGLPQRTRFRFTNNPAVRNLIGDRLGELSRSISPWAGNTPIAPNPVGDADEGLMANQQPYFYSPGPDRDPGKRLDNLYSVKPTFPADTQAQGSN